MKNENEKEINENSKLKNNSYFQDTLEEKANKEKINIEEEKLVLFNEISAISTTRSNDPIIKLLKRSEKLVENLTNLNEELSSNLKKMRAENIALSKRISELNKSLNESEKSMVKFREKFIMADERIERFNIKFAEEHKRDLREIERWKEKFEILNLKYEKESEDLCKSLKVAKQDLTEFRLKAINYEEEILNLKHEISLHEHGKLLNGSSYGEQNDITLELENLRNVLEKCDESNLLDMDY